MSLGFREIRSHCVFVSCAGRIFGLLAQVKRLLVNHERRRVRQKVRRVEKSPIPVFESPKELREMIAAIDCNVVMLQVAALRVSSLNFSS